MQSRGLPRALEQKLTHLCKRASQTMFPFHLVGWAKVKPPSLEVTVEDDQDGSTAAAEPAAKRRKTVNGRQGGRYWLQVREEAWSEGRVPCVCRERAKHLTAVLVGKCW